MKKTIIIIVAVILVIGAGLIFYFVKNNKPDTEDVLVNPTPVIEENTTNQELTPILNCINNATLFKGDFINLNAEVINGEFEISYQSLNSDIASVDENGVVSAENVGDAVIESYITYKEQKISNYTNIKVLNNVVDFDVQILDSDNFEVEKYFVGEYYSYNLITDFNLSDEELWAECSDNIKIMQDYLITNNSLKFTFEIEDDNQFLITSHLKISSTNNEKIFTSETISGEAQTEDEEQEHQSSQTPEQPEQPQREEEQEVEPQAPESEDNDKEEPNNEEQEEEPNQEQKAPYIDIVLSATPSKNVEYNKETNTLTFKDFNIGQLEALSLKVKNTDNYYNIGFDILSGESVDIIKEKAMLGIMVKSIGTTTVELYTIEDPSIKTIITIIVL